MIPPFRGTLVSGCCCGSHTTHHLCGSLISNHEFTSGKKNEHTFGAAAADVNDLKGQEKGRAAASLGMATSDENELEGQKKGRAAASLNILTGRPQ